VVIVGMGNVAVDLARVLTKTDAELAGSDVCDDALRRMRPHRLASIDVLSRSPVARAKFTPVMMRELGQLTAAEVTAIGDGIDGEDEQAAAVRDACAESAAHPDAELTEGEAGPSGRAAEDVPRTAIRLRFGATPERITATPDGLHVTVATADGSRTLEADAVVTAIGFTHATADAARLGEQLAAAPHAGGDTGRLFGVGWFRHGPRGTIPETRRDARAVADTVADALADPAVELGRPGLEAIRPLVPGAITYRQWLRIDAHERSHAPADRCRRKLTDLDAMRRAAAEPAG
jgi:ferredoxin/flavodoxin---NADP+ reductase